MPKTHSHNLKTLVTFYDHNGASDEKLWCETCNKTIWYDEINPHNIGEY